MLLSNTSKQDHRVVSDQEADYFTSMMKRLVMDHCFQEEQKGAIPFHSRKEHQEGQADIVPGYQE